MPTSPENPKDKSIGDAVITMLVPKRAPISSAIIIPAITPISPPIKDRTSASIRN